MKKSPEKVAQRDKQGRQLWRKWCLCGKETITRWENVNKLCRSCGRAEGNGFPEGVLVDPEDEHLKRYSWNINNSGYVKGPGGELHRVVLKATTGQEVHHINANKLDCRKVNLVFTTHSANIQSYWDRKKGNLK